MQKKILMQILSGMGGMDTDDLKKDFIKLYKEFISNFDKNIYEEDKFIVIHAPIKIALYLCQYENIIYKIIRISPFCGKRQTSFIRIKFIFEDGSIPDIKYKDIKIQAKYSSGAGGQHANKTKSAVRLLHIPTKIDINIEETRNFIKNKEIAFKKLNEKVKNMFKKQQDDINFNSYLNDGKIGWSNSNRIVNLHKNKFISIGDIKFNINSILDIPLIKIKELNINNIEDNENK